MSDDDTQVLLTMDMEYKLTVAHRINCWCSRYLIRRREVLLPELARRYMAIGTGDPEDFVHSFMMKLHEQKCPTMPQPEDFVEQVFRKIRDTIGDDPDPEEYPDGTPLDRREPPWGLPRWPYL